jgi:hypothetical protein
MICSSKNQFYRMIKRQRGSDNKLGVAAKDPYFELPVAILTIL